MVQIPNFHNFFSTRQQDGRFDQMLATEDPLKMPTNLARDCLPESPFLTVEESLSQKLYNIWYECINLVHRPYQSSATWMSRSRH